jgi:hypothetical protein
MAEIRVEPRRRNWAGIVGLLVVLAVVAACAYYFLYYRSA